MDIIIVQYKYVKIYIYISVRTVMYMLLNHLLSYSVDHQYSTDCGNCAVVLFICFNSVLIQQFLRKPDFCGVYQPANVTFD